jgi:hypothetical protein
MQDLQTQPFPFITEEEQAELQLMQDTNLLLTNLAEREKVTVKAIIDGLYEVGSARLINQKVSIKGLRGPLKGIARFSKPVFRVFAWRWFKKNCPQLITNWLYKQVRFGESAPLLQSDDTDLIDVAPVRDALPPIVEKQAKEILALRGRITILTATVVVLAIVVCVNVIA